MKLLLVKTSAYEEIVTDFTDFQRNLEVENTLISWQISFTITLTAYNEFVFSLLQSDQASLLLDGQEYVVQQINPVMSGANQTISITATHIYFDIQKKIRLETVIDANISDSSKRPKHSLADYMAFIFSVDTYGYSFEIRGNFNQKILISDFGNSDGLSLINSLIDNFGGYIFADNKNVIYMDDSFFKNITQNQFRYLYNTDEVNLQMDKTNLRTKIWVYPYKNNDKYAFAPYIYTSPNVARFGDAFADSIDLSSDTNATTKSYTDAQAVKNLQDLPETTFTLNYFGSDVPEIGDVWMLIIEPMGMDVDVTVVAINDYPFDDTQPAQITFSNARKDMLSVSQKIAKKANTANKKLAITNSLASSAYNARLTIEVVGTVND